MADIALAILAHPDDAEFLCAGTFARLHREFGYAVHIATLTAGDCGSAEHSAEEIARIRVAEGRAAAQLIGGEFHCLHEPDLLVFHTEATLRKAVQLLRRVRPSVVFTHAASDYHTDHEATSRIARTACFAAPVPLFDADAALGALDHTPHLYYCDPIEGCDAYGVPVEPGLLVDITSVIEVKAAMLAEHASQRNWLLKHHGMDEYTEAMRRWAVQRGHLLGTQFAEGFRQHRGHGYPHDDLLVGLFPRVPA